MDHSARAPDDDTEAAIRIDVYNGKIASQIAS
jgi:hypothetical protein